MHNYPKRTRKFTQSCCQKPSEERALLHCRPHTLASHTSDKYITAPLLAHCTLMVVAADGKCCRITALAMEIAETLYAVKPAAVWQSQPKVVQTALQHVAYEFVWIRRVRVRIRFSVWFVSCYAHVVVLLEVIIIITSSSTTTYCQTAAMVKPHVQLYAMNAYLNTKVNGSTALRWLVWKGRKQENLSESPLPSPILTLKEERKEKFICHEQ